MLNGLQKLSDALSTATWWLIIEDEPVKLNPVFLGRKQRSIRRKLFSSEYWILT
jgi:hypothetical protein